MIIHIFTRDLRILDNNTLNLLYSKTLTKNNKICPIFIFTTDQIINNKFKSDNAIQFMIESLKDLDKSLNNKLGLYYGNFSDIINSIIIKKKPNVISITKDYTPYALNREKTLINICNINKIQCILTDDYYLNKLDIKLYQKYTPYKNIILKSLERIKRPQSSNITFEKITGNFSFTKANKLYKKNSKLNINGGRINGLKQLENLKKQKEYNNTRNNLSLKTSELSAFIKFGCISIREVFWYIKDNINSLELINQLIWRDFYYQISTGFPVLQGPLKQKYSKIKWDNNNNMFNKWKKGKTGFPIVDAGMRQLNTTGFMHNRTRLITASFLVKTLLIDWKLGEHYFATKLYDYDPLINNGNWQWVSSSGADSQPYFRIFNPWLQSKKHDPKCDYIKKWIPELKNIDSKIIHNWYKYYNTPEYKNIYINPIVDFNVNKKKVISAYKKIY